MPHGIGVQFIMNFKQKPAAAARAPASITIAAGEMNRVPTRHVEGLYNL